MALELMSLFRQNQLRMVRTETFCLGDRAPEAVPVAAIHARGRKDYYSFGGAVVAMKEGVMSSATRTLTYLHGDHLGSTSLTTNASGQKVSEQRYKPYGEVRWSSGAGDGERQQLRV